MDVATFNSGSSQTTIAINSDTLNLNLGGIVFDTAAAAYTIGSTTGNALHLSSGGQVQLAATFTGTNVTQTINAPIVLEPVDASSAGSYTFRNDAPAGNALAFGGDIFAGTTSQAVTLTLFDINANDVNTINGSLTAGGAEGGLRIKTIADANSLTGYNKSKWIISGADTNALLTSDRITGTIQLDNGKLTGVSTVTLGVGLSGVTGPPVIPARAFRRHGDSEQFRQTARDGDQRRPDRWRRNRQRDNTDRNVDRQRLKHRRSRSRSASGRHGSGLPNGPKA